MQEHGPRTWHLGFAAERISVATRRSARRRLRSAAITHACAAKPGSTGRASESDQLAVYFGDGTQMLDFRTLQDHDAPRTRSDLLFKGAVEDEARVGVLGPGALAAVGAEVERLPDQPQPRADRRRTGAESIPNLEIEANDVKCSHGSTVGPIDDDQRYYLECRGIPPEEAERLIVLGFFDDVFDRFPVGALDARLAAVGRRQARAPEAAPW